MTFLSELVDVRDPRSLTILTTDSFAFSHLRDGAVRYGRVAAICMAGSAGRHTAEAIGGER